MDRKDIVAMRTGKIILENDGKYWSKEDSDQMIGLFLEGRDIAEIALIMKRSEPAIMQQMKRKRLFAFETKKRNRDKKPSSVCICKKCSFFSDCTASPLKCSMMSEKRSDFENV